MYKVTNPKTGKTYTYGVAKREQAYELAKRLGVEVVVVEPSTYRKTGVGRIYATGGKRCICGLPDDGRHESYDCYKDYRLTRWGYK